MKKILFIAIALIASLTSVAQTNAEATLTVSGSGENEEKATLVALRSAIEQTYGAFVSANTTILNDDLVKDEIVSISTGNIKNYKKLSSVALSNGQISVTLSATVSIGKLINYAQSKGATTEFAGATFAMNIKLMELREQNTLKALCNMWQTVSELSKYAFDYKIETGQPTIAKRTLWASEEKMLAEEQGYYVPIVVTALANEYTSQIEELVKNTFTSLYLSESESDEWYKIGKKIIYHLNLPISRGDNEKEYRKWEDKANNDIYNSLFNFLIEENSGENITYVVHKGDDKYIRTVDSNSDNGKNPYKGYNYEMYYDKHKYHLVDKKRVIHSSLLRGFEIKKRTGQHYDRNWWCGGFYAYEQIAERGGGYCFDDNDWALPIKTTRTPKVLDPAIEKKLLKQYKKAIKQRDDNMIKEVENQLYDFVTTYEKVEQPLIKFSFKVFIPTGRMSQIKGFSIKKNQSNL